MGCFELYNSKLIFHGTHWAKFCLALFSFFVSKTCFSKFWDIRTETENRHAFGIDKSCQFILLFNLFLLLFMGTIAFFCAIFGEIIQSFGGSRHMSTIPLKDSHLFKIVESVISFCFLKKISNSAILNKCESYSGIVDHVTCPPCGPYNFSYFWVSLYYFS